MRADSSRLNKARALCLIIIATGLVIIIIRTSYDKDSTQFKLNLNCEQECKKYSEEAVRNATLQLAPVHDTHSWDYNWDLKASVASDSSSGAGDRVLILIRHGNYDLSNGKLTELGRQQADLTGARLRAMNLSYESITHSTLDRATETANIIHTHLSRLPIKEDEMLVEGGPVPPDPTVSYWKLPDRNYFVDGPRMEAAFRKYFYRNDNTVKGNIFQILVGHGNIFRFFALRSLQLSKDAWMRVFIAHASITMISIRPGGTVAVTLFGDAGHLPFHQVTY